MTEERTSKLVPGTIAALWLLAFGSCIFYLLYSDGDGGGEDSDLTHAVAEISQTGGEVETRGERAMLWSKAGKGRQLAQGSHLATGDNSQAYVRFRDGRRLRLGAHTQAVISEEVKDGESTLVVSQVNGSLTALPPAAPAGHKGHPVRAVALTIRSGGKAVHLDHPEDLAELTKAPGHPVQIVQAPAGIEMALQKPATPSDLLSEGKASEPEPRLKAPTSLAEEVPAPLKPEAVATTAKLPAPSKTPVALPRQKAVTSVRHQATLAAPVEPAVVQAPPAPIGGARVAAAC